MSQDEKKGAGSWVQAPAAVRPREHWGLKWFKKRKQKKDVLGGGKRGKAGEAAERRGRKEGRRRGGGRTTTARGDDVRIKSTISSSLK